MNEIVLTLPDKSTRRVPQGTTVREILPDDPDILAAMVDNLTVGLNYRLVRSAAVVPLNYASREGNEVYRRTLAFLLGAATKRVYPQAKLVIGHSLAGGYYFDITGVEPFDAGVVARLEEEMKHLVAENLPLTAQYMSLREAIELFEHCGMTEKVRLLKRLYYHDVQVFTLGDFCDMPIGPLAATTGQLRRFALVHYPPGMVLRFPDKRNIDRMSTRADQTRLFAVYHESKKWSKIIGIENVGDLNEMVAQKRIAECIQVAEGLHEKKIAQIADRIAAGIDKTKLVFIAGPSSSGKTTFAKRLGIQLRVNGLTPIGIGLDDYFVDREATPKDDRGEYDFESLYALNIDALNNDLVRLLAGEEVTVPRYDFKNGKSVPGDRRIRLERSQVLIVEGIHGLNDQLTPRIAPESKFKIYVSALTQLSIDTLNRIPTTDTRLIRRIVRDRRYRGYPTSETIRRWPSVVRGEKRNIFPYQESADVIFNTALPYELAVLKRFARRFLEEVTPEEPEFAEARRILTFLQLFVTVDDDAVPPTSILREFIGGSSFKY